MEPRAGLRPQRGYAAHSHERWPPRRTSLIPLPPSAAGDLLALCDAQLLDAASCEEIYLHNATREASSGGEPPLMQVRRLDGQTPRAAPVAAASTTAAASHHRRR